MSHLPRLIKVLRVIARYRLDEFLGQGSGRRRLRLLLLPFGLFSGRRQHREKHRNQRLREALQELGPIYIKFGQLLSTRRDFLDPALADELQALQDRVPPFEKPGIEQIIVDSLGVQADEIFRHLDSDPFASASVAQVYRGELHAGDQVVVKVLRPGIDTIVADDLLLLKWAAEQLERHFGMARRLKPGEVIADYERVILNELDLRAEAANTSQLRRNFEQSSRLYVPRVYWDYTRDNIMVMERIQGIPVTDVDALHRQQINLKKLAETGVEIFFTQVFEHNFFHADMHPGNIFVSPDHPEEPQYIAIDCAIIGTLSDRDQDYLAKNLLAIFKRDYRRVAELHIASGWVAPNTVVGEFEGAIRTVCEPIFEKPLQDISFAQLLLQLFRTAGRFDMEVQPSLVLLQKTLLNIEGLGRQLYPELDLWQTALPFLQRWHDRRLNPLTLFDQIQENLPDWLDQLPKLPLRMIEALGESRQLKEINRTLVRQQRLQAARQRRRRKQALWTGSAALLAAGLSLYPPLMPVLEQLPIATLGLLGLGALLLYFRQ